MGVLRRVIAAGGAAATDGIRVPRLIRVPSNGGIVPFNGFRREIYRSVLYARVTCIYIYVYNWYRTTTKIELVFASHLTSVNCMCVCVCAEVTCILSDFLAKPDDRFNALARVLCGTDAFPVRFSSSLTISITRSIDVLSAKTSAVQ